jgi:CRISPR type I-D-associated protein Csc1
VNRGVDIYRCTITPHDFFFYSSREFRAGVTAPFISNLALMYALNRFSPIHRTASGSKPQYEKDMPVFNIYVTPARLNKDKSAMVGCGQVVWREPSSLVRMSYNAVDSPLRFEMKREKVTVPKIGAYLKYPPLTNFSFFTLDGKGENVVRIGKKLIPARVEYHKLENVSEETGRFRPSHPVNLLDLPVETKIRPRGTMYSMPPISLLEGGELEGEYFRGILEKASFYIAKPDFKKYTSLKQ